MITWKLLKVVAGESGQAADGFENYQVHVGQYASTKRLKFNITTSPDNMLVSKKGAADLKAKHPDVYAKVCDFLGVAP